MVKVINIEPEQGLKYKNVLENKPVFAAVLHPTCIHCVNLKPIWKAFEKELKKLNYQVFDSPNTTSACVYKMQMVNYESGSLYVQASSAPTEINAMEIDGS